MIAAVIVALLASSLARANKLVSVTIPDRGGEIPSKWLGYAGPPRGSVILPDAYDPAKRYPLVIYLGGLGGNYATAAAGMTAFHVPGIMVIPEPGNGWYTDWWNGGKRADPAWESYVLDEVVPWALSHYKIRPERRYHAIIGISMGGLGATYLGGRMPGFFGSVATLSGFVDTQFFGLITAAGMALTANTLQKGNNDLNAVAGPWDGFYAQGHNPVNLVQNLRQTRVFQSSGTGVPSGETLNKDPTSVPVGTALELPIIHPMNEIYHRALAAADVDVEFQRHAGGHDAVDGAAEFRAMLAWGLFGPVATHPDSWVNDTVATHGQLWDIGYRFDRPPSSVVRFSRSGSSLSIGDAGSAVTLTTAGGCSLHTSTPATVRVPTRRCRR